MRIDQYLYQNGFMESRTKAQDAIVEKRVKVNGTIIHKCAFQVGEGMQVEVLESEIAFASRAGYKLYDVLKPFEIALKGRICIDVGASTGGFSDVCLHAGASKVYALDVGCDQLLPRLRKDARIVNMEHCNCRYLSVDMFPDKINFACMDVSFISIKKILPALFTVMHTVEAVVLIKPQFEAGKQALNKQGVVKDAKIHIQVLKDMVAFVEAQGYYVKHLCASSLLGRDGNKEFVMHIVSTPYLQVFAYKDIVNNYQVEH